MSTNYPPPPPQYPPPPPQYPYQPPGGPAPRKKTNPLVWILVGIGGFLVLLVLLVAAGGFFLFNKAKQAGFDQDLLKRNPAVAAAKLMVAANPDAELVSMDEGRGIVTVRNKRTGKTFTLNFEDMKNGKFSLEGEGGERVSINGGDVRLPAWLPPYPGAKPQGIASAESSSGAGGAFTFTTKDSLDRVFEFYENALKSAGLNIDSSRTSDEGTMNGDRGDEKQSVSITVAAKPSGTEVQVTFKDQK